MANILFLTQVLPYPLHSGAKIRAYYVLRHLAEQHNVSLVSFIRDDDWKEAIEHLKTFCTTVQTVPMKRSFLRNIRAALKAGLTGQSVIIVRDEIKGMYELLRQMLSIQPFDVIHADQTSMVQYALYARKLQAKRVHGKVPKVVLDAHNALYRIPERMAQRANNQVLQAIYRREARALARFEVNAYRKFDHVVFVTDVDRDILQPQLAGAPSLAEQVSALFTTIPICVDPDEKPLVQRIAHPLAVTHLGTMFWPPNVEGVLWFAKKVFPVILAEVPEARLVIIGKDPPQSVRDLSLGEDRVNVTGYVVDPKPYLEETAVFIVPLHAAGGMRVKIIDAWSWGLPVVSTTIGAEGIEARDGDNLLIGDTPEDVAAAVISILKDPALGQRLRESGRQMVEQYYNWHEVYKAWDEVYNQLLMVT